MSASSRRQIVAGADGPIALELFGEVGAPAVLMTHSILSSSLMWGEQAALLATRGYFVVCADTRGHGASGAPPGPYAMADLVADSVAALDALGLDKVHYIGLSLGGMSGFGLGISHADRLRSLVLCDARADAPPAFAAPWDDRIATARSQGCAALAAPTLERWFGKAFLDARPELARRFHAAATNTSVEGFVGCARAIQGLDYLADVGRIDVPTTLVVGANDGPLPQAMADLAARIPGAQQEVIADAGHLPNVDQAGAFNAALLRHFDRVATRV